MSPTNQPTKAQTVFQRRVFEALTHVPLGKTTTYGILAKAIGCGSAQAIGQALRRNPDAPRIPCHRVVCNNGSIGGFFGERDAPVGALGDEAREGRAGGAVQFQFGAVGEQREVAAPFTEEAEILPEVDLSAGDARIASVELGIDIPRLCFLKDINETSACRLCVVDVKDMRGLKNSCTLAVQDGMELVTDTPEIRDSIVQNLQLLASNHVFECWACEREHNCELLSLMRKFNVENVYGESKSYTKKERMINDQPHELSYINPQEAGLLKALGGSGRRVDGIPAYFSDDGLGDGSEDDGSPSSSDGNDGNYYDLKKEDYNRRVLYRWIALSQFYGNSWYLSSFSWWSGLLPQ